jgi:hypothetical protein
MGISNLLMRQLVGNQVDSPNSVWSNDILVNLISGVNFLRQIWPKSYIIIQAPPLFTLHL